MTIEEVIADKKLKPSEKPVIIGEMLVQKTLQVDRLVAVAAIAKDVEKANCIEAIEHATKMHPELATPGCFDFLISCLSLNPARIKWESARAIGNVAHLFQNKLSLAIQNLLQNTSHSGTVVRWSAAYALGQIIKLKTVESFTLLSVIQEIVEKEEKNSIRKIYLDALKKVKS